MTTLSPRHHCLVTTSSIHHYYVVNTSSLHRHCSIITLSLHHDYIISTSSPHRHCILTTSSLHCGSFVTTSSLNRHYIFTASSLVCWGPQLGFFFPVSLSLSLVAAAAGCLPRLLLSWLAASCRLLPLLVSAGFCWLLLLLCCYCCCAVVAAAQATPGCCWLAESGGIWWSSWGHLGVMLGILCEPKKISLQEHFWGYLWIPRSRFFLGGFSFPHPPLLPRLEVPHSCSGLGPCGSLRGLPQIN